jgi:hypothetical protein
VSAATLLKDYVTDIVKYHIVPNVTLDPSAVTKFDADGLAAFGPYTTAMNTSGPVTTLCNAKTNETYNATTFGKDIRVKVSTDQPAVITCAGPSAKVNATKITCGGTLLVLDDGALFPCYPDINSTELAPLKAQLIKAVADANKTYYDSLKEDSAATMTGAHAALTAAISCITLAAAVFGV